MLTKEQIDVLISQVRLGEPVETNKGGVTIGKASLPITNYSTYYLASVTVPDPSQCIDFTITWVDNTTHTVKAKSFDSAICKSLEMLREAL